MHSKKAETFVKTRVVQINVFQITILLRSVGPQRGDFKIGMVNILLTNTKTAKGALYFALNMSIKVGRFTFYF